MPGGRLQVPHMQDRKGEHPTLQGTEHLGTGHWLLGRAHACPYLTLVHTHSRWHQHGTVAGTQMWLWVIHDANMPVSVHTCKSQWPG